MAKGRSGLIVPLVTMHMVATGTHMTTEMIGAVIAIGEAMVGTTGAVIEIDEIAAAAGIEIENGTAVVVPIETAECTWKECGSS